MTLSLCRSILIISLLGLSLNHLYSFQQSTARKKTKYEFTDTRISEADTLLKKRKYQDALIAYQKAYDTYETEQFYEGMVYAKERMGYAFRRSGRDSLYGLTLEKSLRLLKSNLEKEHVLFSKIYLELGLRYYRKRDFMSASLYMDSSSAAYGNSNQREDTWYSSIVQYKYYTYFFSNRSNDTLVKYLDERDRIFKIQSSISNKIFLLSDYSATYSRIGNFQRAAAYALEAVRICEENSERVDPYYFTDALFNLGNALNSQKQYERALKVANQLVSRVRGQTNKSRDYLAYLNLQAVILNNLGRYEEASTAFDNIILELENRGTINTRFYRNAVMNLGVSYQLMGRDSLASHYLLKALTREKHAKNTNSSVVSPNYKYLGQYYTGKNDHENGLFYYDSAIRVKLNYDDYDLLSYPKQNSFEVTYDALNILKSKQNSLVEYSKGQVNEDRRLLLSSIDYTENIHKDLMESRKKLEASEGKLFLSQNFKSLYEKGMEATFLLGETSDDHLRSAFNFLGYSKSILFLEQAGELNGLQDDRLTAGLRNKFYNTKTEVDRLEERFSKYIDSVITSDSLRKINTQLIEANARLDTINQEISSVLGKEGEPEVFSKNGFDNVLRYLANHRETAIIEFFVGEKHFYVLALTHEGRAFKRIENTELLRNSLLEFFQMVSNRPAIEGYRESLSKYLSVSNYLYNELLEPVLNELNSEIKKLKIIPDGQLSQLPFEALVSELNEDVQSFQDLDYLINTYSISYALSSKQIKIKPSKKHQNGRKLLAIGYSGGGVSEIRSGSLGSLPGTENEIRFLKQSNVDGEFLFGDDGRKEVFLSKARDFDILHLAVHGEADTTNRYQSNLIFSGTGDNTLKTNDLYLAGLNARLAILSACESGSGQISKGEGTFSIARGFVLVGVPSVVMSLWKVNDRVASTLMVSFHEELAERQSVDVALSETKRDFLINSDQYTSHPYYWSAFVSLGEDAYIFYNKKPLWESLLLWSGAFLASLAIFLIYKKNRKKRKGVI